mgnify:CR=1 FL=1
MKTAQHVMQLTCSFWEGSMYRRGLPCDRHPQQLCSFQHKGCDFWMTMDLLPSTQACQHVLCSGETIHAATLAASAPACLRLAAALRMVVVIGYAAC